MKNKKLLLSLIFFSSTFMYSSDDGGGGDDGVLEGALALARLSGLPVPGEEYGLPSEFGDVAGRASLAVDDGSGGGGGDDVSSLFAKKRSYSTDEDEEVDSSEETVSKRPEPVTDLEMVSHGITYHKNDNGTWDCSKCSKKNMTINGVYHHYRNHLQNPCTYCRVGFETSELLKKHRKTCTVRKNNLKRKYDRYQEEIICPNCKRKMSIIKMRYHKGRCLNNV